eukprot:gnl/TRDRNA2_/TRDRNA2_153997_c0_seq1.p1 gnl/TRDRNA2_/TRDRNA2_153997_c0~~gnl/TRDRNA2_/TRDRNA2_153997_c0_seq1.p1  ORF type:complete len:500 (-),score=62.75 gnl/TRDRNA2_/TRDRNA2_153997_c0_seq1:79-1578(-)
MQPPHTRAIPCPLCHQKFFPQSMPFHIKQCEKKQSTRIVPCPYCRIDVVQLDLPAHIKKCPKGAGRGKNASPGPSARQNGGGNSGAAASYSAEAAGPVEGAFAPEVLDDGRMRCVHCGRFFDPERIDKHQGICGKLKSARPPGVDGVATQHGRRVFNSEAQRRLDGLGKCFLTPEQYKRQEEKKRQEAAKQHNERMQKAGKWRQQSEEFQAACRAGRGEDLSRTLGGGGGGRGNGLTVCPYCQRSFAPDAAERHIAICKNVINRPRPPPSPAPSRASPKVRSRGGSTPRSCENGFAVRPPSSPSPGTPVCGSPQAIPPRMGRSASCSGLSAADTLKLSARGEAGGSATSAARSLRRWNSRDRLPGLHDAPGSGRGESQSDAPPQFAATAGPGGFGATSTSSPSMNSTLRKPPLAGRHSSRGPQAAVAAARSSGERARESDASSSASWSSGLGLRRSAMLYRLLSQVPSQALARELTDAGTNADNLDQERLIEAVLEQLA